MLWHSAGSGLSATVADLDEMPIRDIRYLAERCAEERRREAKAQKGGKPPPSPKRRRRR